MHVVEFIESEELRESIFLIAFFVFHL